MSNQINRKKMSELKDLILSDKNLFDFFKDKPLWEMINRGLAVDEINSKILGLETALSFEKNEKVLMTKLDERKNLIVKVLMEMVEEVKKLCMVMNGDNEHMINDESFPVDLEVRNLGFVIEFPLFNFSIFSSLQQASKFS
jgi:hypothetical protein